MQVLSVDSNNTNALFTLGQLYTVPVFSRPTKAIELFSHAIEQQPTHPEAMVALAKVYSKEGRCKEAKDMADSLLKIEPQLAIADAAKKILETC